jgi:hypothetical protein
MASIKKLKSKVALLPENSEVVQQVLVRLKNWAMAQFCEWPEVALWRIALARLIFWLPGIRSA